MENQDMGIFDRLKNRVEDTDELAQSAQDDLSDGCVLDEELKDVTGGGMFADIVTQASPFKPKNANDQKKPSGF